MKDATEARRVLVVGAGTMGTQIALQCALFGLEVVVYDRDSAALARAPEAIAKVARGLLRKGFITGDRAAAVKVHTVADLAEACRDIDLVSESVIEDLGVKRKLWAELTALLPEHTILTTNTSTLLASEIAEACPAPERFIAWHFHLPAFTANVVDVMPHSETAPYVTAFVEAFSRRVGQVPVVLQREHREYVFNSMLVAWLRQAQGLAATDVASVEDIDRAWMIITGMAIGPFGIMDMIGLDTVMHIIDEARSRAPNDKHLKRVTEWLKPKLAARELGRKTGVGFYRYPGPAFEEPGFAPRVLAGSP